MRRAELASFQQCNARDDEKTGKNAEAQSTHNRNAIRHSVDIGRRKRANDRVRPIKGDGVSKISSCEAFLGIEFVTRQPEVFNPLKHIDGAGILAAVVIM